MPQNQAASEKRLNVFRSFVRVLDLAKPYPYYLHINNLFGALQLSERGKLISASQVRRMWERFSGGRGASEASEPVNLYLGAPFCSSRCRYCIYFKSAGARPEELSRYALALERSAAYYADVLKSMVFRHVYFGGGTPSLFSASSLGSICETLRRNVRTAPGGERAIEVNPASVTLEKLEVLTGFFNKMSVGVQSLSPDVLRQAGRGGQTLEMVKKTIEGGRSAGFGTISVDLLRGLFGDDGQAFLDSLKKLIPLRPDIIRVYPLIPDADYLQSFYGGSMDTFLSKADSHEGFFQKAVELAYKNGYIEPPGRDPDMPISTRFVEFHLRLPSHEGYSFRSEDLPQSVLGLGHHANSYINSVAHYHSTPLKDDPEENQYRCMEVSPLDEMRRHVLSAFSCAESVSEDEFKSLFKAELRQVFAREVSTLLQMGMISISRGRISLLPVDPRERLACAMYFVEFDELFAYIKKLSSQH